MSQTQIGWYHVDETQIIHYQGYETASWWTEYELEASKYPIIRSNEAGWRGWVHISFHGIVTDDYFENRLFWAVSSERGKYIGCPFNTTVNICTSMFAGPGNIIESESFVRKGSISFPAGHYEFFDFVGFEFNGTFYMTYNYETKTSFEDRSRPMIRTTYSDNLWKELK